MVYMKNKEIKKKKMKDKAQEIIDEVTEDIKRIKANAKKTLEEVKIKIKGGVK